MKDCMKLKYLNGQMLLLCKREPDVKIHSPEVKPTETFDQFNWNKVLTNVKF